MEKEVLQGYLEKLIMLQERSDDRFNEESFRIAIDSLGLSKKELDELEVEFDQQFKQGSNYYRSKNYKKAIQYLEVARQIEPFHLAALLLLVDSYKMLYLESPRADYVDKLNELCQLGLQIQSFNPYFAKVETLVEKAEKLRKARLRRFGLSALMIVGALVGVYAIFTANYVDFQTGSIIGAVLSAIFGLTNVPPLIEYNRTLKNLRKTTIKLKFVKK